MAKVTITLTCSDCGTEYTQVVEANNRAEADRKADWISKQSLHLCPECYKTAAAAERAAEAKAAAEKVATCGLNLSAIKLNGTEKQVKWATDLRAKAVNDILRGRTPNAAALALLTEVLSSAEWTDAHVIIDNRGGLSARIMAALKTAAANRK